MRYLGIKPRRLRVGVFDLTGCEGCELQLVNKEETLGAFLDAVDVVCFREASDQACEDIDVALVEGCVTRSDEVERLQHIRERARVLVALGSCACFGGVTAARNALDLDQANREVYGMHPKETGPTRSLREVVPVDLCLPGCPVSKGEVERVVQHLLFDLPFRFEVYPVCVDCKHRYTTCLFDLGQLCLGPITRGGCDAPCPAGGQGCWGCRGPVGEPNMAEMISLAREHGFSLDELDERLAFFGAFEEQRALLREER